MSTLKRSLNFLHLTTFYPPYSFGGDAMYLYRLCHALGDQGHDVDVVHCVDSYHLLHPDEPTIQFKEHSKVATHRLKSGFGWLSPLATHQTGSPVFKRKPILEIMQSKPYDVIHFHNTSLLGPRALRLNPPKGRPIKLYTTHEHWLICPTHVLWKYGRRPCEKPDCLRCSLLAKRPPQLWRGTGLLKRSARHIDQFVSPSRFTADMHAQRGFPYPVAHLPYFTQRADYDWKAPGPRPQERPYFLFVGRLEFIKGLQDLIGLWHTIPEADLLVAGTGTYEAQLHQLAAGNPGIKFLGAVPQERLGGLYTHAVATLVPSLTYETFGIIIIESFARKTPVIVRALGALPEVVEDSQGGFTYQNDGELLSAVRQLMSSPSLQGELGENGYLAFVRLWSPEAHLTRYFEYLNSIALRKLGAVPWTIPASQKDHSVEHSRG